MATSQATNITLPKIKFVIVNFEFSPLPQGDWLLLTGAMVNTLNKYKPYRLIGNPIFIPRKGKITPYHPWYHKNFLRFAQHCFEKKKPEKLASIKAHLKEGIMCENEKATLDFNHINKYLFTDGRKPVMVFWNGMTHKDILLKLNVKNIMTFLDITTVRNKEDSTFELILKDMNRNNRIILTLPLGYFEKENWGTLNLRECHSIICDTKHEGETFSHDPCVDIIYTRCIFNYIIQRIRAKNLYNYCAIHN